MCFTLVSVYCAHYLTAHWKWPLADPRPHFPFPPIETQGSPYKRFWGSSCWQLPVPLPHCEYRTFLDLTNGCLELEKSTSSALSCSFLPPVTFSSWRRLEVVTALPSGRIRLVKIDQNNCILLRDTPRKGPQQR